jgi:glycosyltransferase involved in cell wall biosynthesis
MKIVLATPLYPPEIGGPATYAEILIRELPKRGIEVELVKFSDVRHLPPVVRHIAYAGRVFRSARGAKVIYALDAVSVGWPAFFANLFHSKKFIVKMVGDHIWEQGRQRFGITQELDALPNASLSWHPYLSFLRLLQQIVMRAADRVIVPSEYLKKVITRWGIREGNIEVIYNGITLPDDILLPTDRPKGLLVVSAGRRVPWKGFEALERVVGKHTDWHLKIIHDMPRGEALGWVKSADVFVLNSRYEGLSHILLEAVALGTPIVATNAGGNGEVVKDGETGLLMPVGDDEALSRALDAVAQNPSAADERAERAKAQDFSEATMVSKTVQLLTSI